MTVRELKKALKGFGDSDIVYMVKDWSVTNERGELTELAALKDVTSQRVFVDMGLDFDDITQILLEFEEN